MSVYVLLEVNVSERAVAFIVCSGLLRYFCFSLIVGVAFLCSMFLWFFARAGLLFFGSSFV